MLEYHVLDVFTDAAYSGNPLAVVLGSDDLTTAQMQTISREFNLSETIFVQQADNTDHTAKVRIFHPTAELPFAGHQPLAARYYWPNWPIQVTLPPQYGLKKSRFNARKFATGKITSLPLENSK